MRDATREIRGAVNGIDDPHPIADLTAAFFTKETIVWETSRDRPANMRLGSRIGHCQKILRPLHGEASRRLTLKTFEYQFAGG